MGDINIYNNPEDRTSISFPPSEQKLTLRHEVQRLVQEAKDMISQLTHLQRNIPPVIGHTRANALRITDALGESLTIPWSMVPSYEVGVGPYSLLLPV